MSILCILCNYQDYMKDFKKWNSIKTKIEIKREETYYFDEREIWWSSLGLNVGHEEDGKNQLYERPVLILKKFNSKIVWVLPMSSKIKSGKYYYQIEYGGVIYTVLLSQLKLMSSKRLIRQVQQIKKVALVDFRNIKAKLIELISEN